MKYLLLFLALNLMGCNKGPQNVRSIDSRLEPYVDMFETLSNNVYPVNIIVAITIPSGPDGVEGDCQIANENGVSEVDIDPIFVSNELQLGLYSYGLEQVVFHELGHCILFRQHNPNLIAVGEPVSIMYPYTFESMGTFTLNYYVNNRNYYFSELVNNYGK